MLFVLSVVRLNMDSYSYNIDADTDSDDEDPYSANNEPNEEETSEKEFSEEEMSEAESVKSEVDDEVVPPRDRPITHPDICWNGIKSCLDQAYVHGERLTPLNVMLIATHVFNYCTRPFEKRDIRGADEESERDGVFLSLQLRLQKYWRDLVGQYMQDTKELDGAELLREYLNRYRIYDAAQKYLKVGFAHVDDYVVQRVASSKRSHIGPYPWILLNNTILELSKLELHKFICKKIADACIKAVELDRKGLPNGCLFYLRDVLCTFDIVPGIVSCDQVTGIQFYHSAFETVMLDESRLYYQKLSETTSITDSPQQYLDKVSKILATEKERSDRCFHLSTWSLLEAVLYEVLVLANEEAFRGEWTRYLDMTLLPSNDVDPMTNIEELYRLLVVLRNHDGFLRFYDNQLKEYIRRSGVVRIAKRVEELISTPDAFVCEMVEFYDAALHTWSSVFKIASSEKLLDQAFTEILSDNAVKRSKIVELLGAYYDKILRAEPVRPFFFTNSIFCTGCSDGLFLHIMGTSASTKISAPEFELQVKLWSPLAIFKHMSFKAAFEKYYLKLLIKRYLHGSVGSAGELSAYEALRSVSNSGDVGMIRRIVTDMLRCSVLHGDFVAYCQSANCNLDSEFSARILFSYSQSWPLLTDQHSIILPFELERPLAIFRNFYARECPKQQLTWVLRSSTCDLEASCFRKPTMLRMTAYQTTVLLLFNNRDAYTVGEMSTLVGCDKSVVDNILTSLIKSGILLLDFPSPGNKRKHPLDNTVRLNFAYCKP